ncbi:MAG: hypothetical protein C0602_00230 [Denitrovibrio sp.]|nr:MAG: hypothetical protein C0602_00230 [Denitrovibrio sp.]
MSEKHIGNMIREIRKKKNHTQKQLGKIIGVSAQQVHKYEQNMNPPKISILTKISDRYGIDFNVFLSGNLKEALRWREYKEEYIENSELYAIRFTDVDPNIIIHRIETGRFLKMMAEDPALNIIGVFQLPL